MKHDGGEPDRDRPRGLLVALGAVLSTGVLLGVWVALAGDADLQDLVGGCCAAGLAVGVGYLVSQQGRALPSLRWTDLSILVALPRQLVVETWQVYTVAARKLVGVQVEAGSWSTVDIATGTEVGGWPAARHDAVLTALMSAAPNTIVVDVDAEAGTALLHRLVSHPGNPGSSPADVAEPTPGGR